MKLNYSEKFNSELRWSGTLQHILTCQLISKLWNKAKAVRVIWTLIEYMIDVFRKTTPDVCQNVDPEVDMKQELVIVSDTQKSDLTIMAF